MVSMPYMFQKGPDWQLLESYLNAADHPPSRINRKLKMRQLVCDSDGMPPLTKGDLPSEIPDVDDFKPGDLLTHLQKDWFGEDPGDPENKLRNHPHNGKISDGKGADPARRGWWVNWYGTPSEIFKEALCRAIEVSLGLDHGEVPPKNSNRLKRDWPIEFLWICPVGWFQAGITWRQSESKKKKSRSPDPYGLVTLTWLTPGNTRSASVGAGAEHGLFNDLNTAQRAKAAPGDIPPQALDPPKCDDPRGHWIVGHTVTESVAHLTTVATGSGMWPAVVPSATSVNPKVTTVQPAWGDGGVDPFFP